MTEKKNYRILIVDDEVEYQTVFSYILSAGGYMVETASSGREALEKLEKESFDLVMTDFKIPEMDGLALMKEVKDKHPGTEVMIITAFGTVESAVDAMKHGAAGYFIKGNDPEELIVDINRLAKIKLLENENRFLQESFDSDDMFLASKNRAYNRVLETCRKVAKSDINVLILGESGVGKEIIAKYIHRLSGRKGGHFVAVNCQVFGDGTLESELFGHEKGAFTGAVEKRIGRFETANGGTLFLDEIGDMPMSIQGKLLRVLETKTIERVGSNRAIDLDTRFISATNKDLESAIEEGTFREDLLFRINTITVTVPPLRERMEDLPGLVDFFVRKIEKDQKKKITRISDDAWEYLLNYDFPGNVRELKNILERMVALSENGELCSIGTVSGSNSGSKNLPCGVQLQSSFDDSLRDARAQFEKNYIENVLKNCGGNVSQAADVLKITKRQLWNKISEYNITK